MFDATDLLYNEWDLGKTASKATGKICAWVYLMLILEESETIVIERINGRLIGFCGYSKWGSRKKLIPKKFYSIIKRILMLSPSIKSKEAIIKYNKDYSYTPKNMKDYFDGEISIIIVNKKYRGKGFGKKMLLKIFDIAEKDNLKNLQILSDESCNFKFYEHLGCKRIYETNIPSGESGRGIREAGYIYEKRFKAK